MMIYKHSWNNISNLYIRAWSWYEYLLTIQHTSSGNSFFTFVSLQKHYKESQQFYFKLHNTAQKILNNSSNGMSKLKQCHVISFEKFKIIHLQILFQTNVAFVCTLFLFFITFMSHDSAKYMPFICIRYSKPSIDVQ